MDNDPFALADVRWATTLYQLIRTVDLEALLFIDIETVPEYNSYDELKKHNPRKAQLWEEKFNHSTRLQQKYQSAEEAYIHEAGIFPEFGKVIVIGIGAYARNTENNKSSDYQLRVRVAGSSDEHKLLNDFTSLLKQGGRFPRRTQVWQNQNAARPARFPTNALYLVGHNIREFDVPFLARRLLIANQELPPLLQIAGMRPWQILHLIDTMELWQFGDQRGYISLDLLTCTLDIPSPKQHMRGKDVFTYYLQGKWEDLLNYCAQDVIALAQIVRRFQGMQLLDINKDIDIQRVNLDESDKNDEENK